MNPQQPAFGGGGGATDTLSLAHFNGADAAPAFQDEVAGTTWAISGGTPELDTAQQKFGTASLLILGNEADAAQGSGWPTPHAGDWTIEGFIRFSNLTANFFTPRASILNDASTSLLLNLNDDGLGAASWAYRDAADLAVATHTSLLVLAVDTWYHWAAVRSGTAYHSYFNGVRVGTTASAAATGRLDYLRLECAGGTGNAWYDEIRVSKVARYTGATLTVPVAAFVVD